MNQIGWQIYEGLRAHSRLSAGVALTHTRARGRSGPSHGHTRHTQPGTRGPVAPRRRQPGGAGTSDTSGRFLPSPRGADLCRRPLPTRRAALRGTAFRAKRFPRRHVGTASGSDRRPVPLAGGGRSSPLPGGKARAKATDTVAVPSFGSCPALPAGGTTKRPGRAVPGRRHGPAPRSATRVARDGKWENEMQVT